MVIQPNTSKLFMDFESYSEVDIEKKGGMRYSLDESTEMVCLGYALDDEDVGLLTPAHELPVEVAAHVVSKGKVYAHNATFDYRIWNNVCVPSFGWPALSLNQMVDTQALAQTYSLPGSLDKAGKAANILMKKAAGKALIKRCCCPQEPDGRKPEYWDHNDRIFFDQLFDYCKQDVRAMRDLVNKLPRHELLPIEQELWELTYHMNSRGLPINKKEVQMILEVTDEFIDKRSGLLHVLSNGAFQTVNQYQKIGAWCRANGFDLQNLQADYLEEVLDDPEVSMPQRVREVLELRQLLGKSSTAKYRKFRDLAMYNGSTDAYHVHDNLCFHGAGPGRWAARGVQMHNFPRSKIKTAQAEELLAKFRTLEDPVGTAKSLVRSSICAPLGYKLLVTDYSSIENRVLAWLAGDELTLQKFRDGLDQYKDMAVDRYHVAYDQVTEDMRQMGKVIILGCGYGMGWETFISTAKKQFKMIITKEDAQLAVKAYREKYDLVKDLWKNLKEAASRCVITGVKQTCGLITFGIFRKNGIKWLAMVLPSGKAIYYMEPRIEYHHIPKFEEMGKVPTIVHLGLHPYSKKWTKLKLIPGRITENATQGTAREIMGHGMLNVDKKMPEAQLIGTVHDEALALIREELITADTQKRFDDLLCDVSWAKACPIAAKGFIDKRYRKD